MSDLTKDTLVGLSLLGRGPEVYPMIIRGEMDYYVGLISYQMHFNKCATNKEELETPLIKDSVADFKQKLVGYIQMSISAEETPSDIRRREFKRQRGEAERRDAELKKIHASLLSANKPHDLGTVAEIAAKYGISKSEVRRRKANNTLHELEANQ